ncbi:hypothetical protein EDB86DRAFT_2831904 [Lactarius hatsudake]|nr:hypothetical protein EDB86DRAFT_2831904 [Lactarius hatsudake]
MNKRGHEVSTKYKNRKGGAGAGGGGAGARVLSLVGQRVVVESYHAAPGKQSGRQQRRKRTLRMGCRRTCLRCRRRSSVTECMRVPCGPVTCWVVSRDSEGGLKYVAPPPAPRGQSDHVAGEGKARDIAGS